MTVWLLGGQEQDRLADAMRKSCISRTSLLTAGRFVRWSVGFVVGHRCFGDARFATDTHTHLIRKCLGERVARPLRNLKLLWVGKRATKGTPRYGGLRINHLSWRMATERREMPRRGPTYLAFMGG